MIWPSDTRAADRSFLQWIDLEPNTDVWFQRLELQLDRNQTRIIRVGVPDASHCTTMTIQYVSTI